MLGVYHGIVRTVLKVEGYEWTSYDAESKTYFNKERCCFYGVLIEDSPYINKDVNDYPLEVEGQSDMFNLLIFLSTLHDYKEPI